MYMPKGKKKSDPWLYTNKVYKGKVCLVTHDGTMIVGDARFTAKKTKAKGGVAIFDITLIKQL